MDLVVKNGDSTKSIDIDLVDERCLDCPRIKLESITGYFTDTLKLNRCEHVYFCR